MCLQFSRPNSILSDPAGYFTEDYQSFLPPHAGSPNCLINMWISFLCDLQGSGLKAGELLTRHKGQYELLTQWFM